MLSCLAGLGDKDFGLPAPKGKARHSQCMLDENMIRRVRGQIQTIFPVSVCSNVRGFAFHFSPPKRFLASEFSILLVKTNLGMRHPEKEKLAMHAGGRVG